MVGGPALLLVVVPGLHAAPLLPGVGGVGGVGGPSLLLVGVPGHASSPLLSLSDCLLLAGHPFLIGVLACSPLIKM